MNVVILLRPCMVMMIMYEAASREIVILSLQDISHQIMVKALLLSWPLDKRRLFTPRFGNQGARFLLYADVQEVFHPAPNTVDA